MDEEEPQQFCQDSDSEDSEDYPSDEESLCGPIEFCQMCGVPWDNKEDGCEFCESKLDSTSDQMDED
jgi:hypothetical protein